MCQHFTWYQVIFIRSFSVYKFLETEKLENQLEGGRRGHLQTSKCGL